MNSEYIIDTIDPNPTIGELVVHIETLRKSPTWSLKAMIKALSLPISSFLNTDEDNERLENAKKVIKERKNK